MVSFVWSNSKFSAQRKTCNKRNYE